MNDIQIFGEEFFIIKDFPNYAVSKSGRILSIKKNKLLKTHSDKKGYERVSLSKDGKVSEMLLHRIVANQFICNPKNLPCVNHKDENTHNNNVDNLEWCTYKYNNEYGGRKWKYITSPKTKRSSGFRGVTFHKRDKKWYAHIGIDGKLIHLGVFKDKREAIKARLEAEEIYYAKGGLRYE